MNSFRHSLSPKSALRLFLIVAILSLAFPADSDAVKAGGGTTTTMVLTYVNGVKKWVCRVDPENIQSFQLDIMFDPARVQLDQSVGINGIIYKNPFIQTTAPDFTQLAAGLILNVAGETPATSPGDVDIFELVFIDLQPLQPIDGVPFTVFASSNDSIVAFDTITMLPVTYNFTQIAPTTRTSTTDSEAHIWDPDTAYNNGTTGGSGTWDTSVANNSWDDLPIAPGPFADTAWNNDPAHADDIAVFGGNPGTGIVTVAGSILVGGFQFDNSGYNIQGGTITLSATPMGARPTIDTGANSATISSAMNGSAFTKVGTGTLTLAGPSNFAGNVIVSAGTLAVDGSLSSGLLVHQGTLSGNGIVNGPVTIGDAAGSADALIAPGTDGVGIVTVGTLTLLSDAAYKLELNSDALAADKIMTLGLTDLSNGIAQLIASDLGSTSLALGFTFTIVDNTSTSPTNGFFAGLPGGSTFAVGANTFQIDYNVGPGGNDVQLTVVVPEPGTWAMLLSGVGILFCSRRFRR